MNQPSLQEQIASLETQIQQIRLSAAHCERAVDARDEYAYANKLEAELNALRAQQEGEQ